MSDEHFTVDGTLIEAWASQKSFRRKDGKGNPPDAGGEVDFHGEKRKNQTHGSTTDPDARLFKKSKGSEAKLGYLGHVLMENRNGLLVQTFLTEANGRAERDAAMLMAEALPSGKRVTLGGDKNYDTRELVEELRGMNITPHVAQNNTNRRSAVDERTTRHGGYEVSQRKRKRVEQSFGWMKMVGMLKKVKLRGIDKVGWLFTFTGAAYNLCRLRKTSTWPASTDSLSSARLFQLCVLGFRGDENGNVRVGVFPKREEILICRLGFCGVALQHTGAGEAEMGECAD